MKKILSLFLTLAIVIGLFVPAASAEPTTGATTTEFAFLVTSDLHGQIYSTDYSAGYEASGTGTTGLTRIATYIKQMRAKYGENLYLADLGDTIQGAPLTYYYAFNKPEADDPAMKAFRTLGYDLWVPGNHEFNYGLDILNRQMNYLTSDASGKETPAAIMAANYLDAQARKADPNSWKTWKNYKPYEIREFDGVKVAIIGLANPNIPKWDIPANWEGIHFAGIYETYKHYEKEMKDQADMIAVMTHCGMAYTSEAGDLAMDSVKYLVEKTDSIDFVFSGHEHGTKVLSATNTAGKSIPIVQPNTKAKAIGQIIVTYDKDKKAVTSLDATNVSMTQKVSGKTVPCYDIDPELGQILKPYEEATWNDYMLQVIGKSNGNYSAAGLGTAPSAFMDLVNRVQILGAYDRTGKNTPNNPDDDTPAQLSISAPLTSGSKENLIPKGDICLGDMFSLYRFENWFYQIRMSGKEVRTWLEYSASKIYENNGKLDIKGGLTYYDVIYGDGFSYTIDAAQPAGSRVVRMTYNAKPVTDDQVFTVVLNNYRFNGGGDYVNYLNSHGCTFKANDPDRIIYSSQFDMINGEDEGQARSLLVNYIKEQTAGQSKGITPDITSNWKIINSSSAKSDDIVVLYTNDVHTYIDNKAGKGLRYSDVAGYRVSAKKFSTIGIQ